MNRPNVIYLHSHDTGRRVSPYGHAVPTPNFMRLAEGGLTFRRAFCCAPTCSPSRAALLTGRFAHCTGMTGLHHRGFQLTHPERHLANTLRKSGYDTALVGVNHVASDTHSIGYDRVIPHETARAEHVGPAAAAFIAGRGRASAAGGADRPFFLDCGFVETHRGQFPPHDARDDPARQLPPAGLPDTPTTRLDAAHFSSAARRLDGGVGLVLDALDAAGLAENTLIVCTTDHGVGFPRHKCNCTDAGTGVLLILRGPAGDARPGGFAGGGVCDALVSHVDVYPTLCRALGIDPPDWLQGRDLSPVLRGEAAEVNEHAFSEVTYHAAYEPQRAVRSGRYKLIRRFGDRRAPVLANVDDGLSKDEWVAAGFASRDLPAKALYDLEFDPTECDDLLARRDLTPEVAAVAAGLRDRLDRWMRETDDPLLAGPVPLPAGAVANAVDDPSPKLDPSVVGPAVRAEPGATT